MRDIIKALYQNLFSPEKRKKILQAAEDKISVENVKLRSRIQGLKVNRDALFEENKRLRSVVIADVETIKELKSEHEGKMDDYHEVVTQLELKITTLKSQIKVPEDLCIMIIQQAKDIYYWALVNRKEQLAHSRNIDSMEIIDPEAAKVAVALGLPIIVNERK